MKRLGVTLLMLLMAGVSFADETKEVHVYQEKLVGGVRTQLCDQILTTGGDYTTQMAPAIGGQIFTHWSISRTQAFVNRDWLGRAQDSVSYHLYESTTLTANYLPEEEDTDGDGIADGYEIYWYGNLNESADSDTDGDGYTFVQELAAGTSPLMPDRSIAAGVVYLDSDEWLYNPSNYPTLTVRSEPEGFLFDTISEPCVPGETVASATYVTALGEAFAYWTKDGTRIQDVFGRAVESVAFAMPSNDVTLVAVAVEDEIDRQKLYWYGTTSVALESDTDGDGYTFEQEIAAGTNPLMPDRSIKAGVVWRDSDEWLYNPSNYCEYVIRSEPEGMLFDTITGVVPPGKLIPVPTVAKKDGFAYWTLNGVRQADAFGRARETLSLAAPSAPVTLVAVVIDDEREREAMYWYGEAMAADSDTDGDGYTFAQELAAGTNPRMPDRSISGGVVWRDSDEAEVNLQPYEQMIGALVDDKYTELFTSPIAGNGATSRTFANGTQIWPVVADVNGDGLWDLIVVSETTTNVFVNVGSKGNPQFKEEGRSKSEEVWKAVDLLMNSTAKLATLDLDVEPIAALSATTNGNAILVSDAEGRIWYYLSTPTPNTYSLQYKVWGGSYAGFAQGLRLAAVDWEDDGDLDCLCGTAEGKLMLLRDPKVGRPTNLKAAVGVDNVKLDWDPNVQSRVRGYKVYRGDEVEKEGGGGQWSVLASPSLPTYRDTGLAPGEYAYKVSALSRFYVAGNSMPTVTESVATDPVFANIGSASFFWNDAAVKQSERVEVMLSIENSLNYNVAGKSQTITFDPEYLTFVKVVKTGLTENLTLTESCENGQLTVSITSGTLAAGSGKFLSFVFEAKKSGTTKVGDATVVIEPGSDDPTEVVPYSLGDVDGNGKVNELDLRLLAKLKNGTGRKYTADQLKAGDFNGNGRLDNADYQALRALLRSMEK